VSGRGEPWSQLGEAGDEWDQALIGPAVGPTEPTGRFSAADISAHVRVGSVKNNETKPPGAAIRFIVR
jgi:hypothetical protein